MDLITILEGAPPPDVGERPEEQERRRRFRPTLVDAGM